MKAVWAPGERVIVRLPLPGRGLAVALVIGLIPVFTFFAASMGMSFSHVDSGSWVPFMLLTLFGGLTGGVALARVLFGSWLTLDWSTRVATITGRSARTFGFAQITGIRTQGRAHKQRYGTSFLCVIELLTGADRLQVRSHSGTLKDRKQLERLTNVEAGELARSLKQKVIAE